MEKIRKYLMAGGTLACALGVGFFMQHGRDVPQAQAPSLQPVAVETMQIATLAPVPETVAPQVAPPVAPQSDSEIAAVTAPELPAEPEVTKNGMISLDEVTLTAATPDPVLPRALPDEVTPRTATLMTPSDLPSAPNDPSTPQLGCSVIAQATEVQAAMARLTVIAPCYKNERVTVHHNGMMFTDVTDDMGNLSVAVPVLNEHAIFVLAFANGKGAVAQAHVPDLADYDRIALQWSGLSGFQIHAREYGAGYGDLGHVWSGSARTSIDAVIGDGGFVTRLGDPDTLAPQVVEVYTFPTKAASEAGTVALSIEAEVTNNNCGRDVSAQVLSLSPSQALETRDLILSVPDCDAIGDFLVLNNLVDNLKIAGR